MEKDIVDIGFPGGHKNLEVAKTWRSQELLKVTENLDRKLKERSINHVKAVCLEIIVGSDSQKRHQMMCLNGPLNCCHLDCYRLHVYYCVMQLLTWNLMIWLNKLYFILFILGSVNHVLQIALYINAQCKSCCISCKLHPHPVANMVENISYNYYMLGYISIITWTWYHICNKCKHIWYSKHMHIT